MRSWKENSNKNSALTPASLYFFHITYSNHFWAGGRLDSCLEVLCGQLQNKQPFQKENSGVCTKHADFNHRLDVQYETFKKEEQIWNVFYCCVDGVRLSCYILRKLLWQPAREDWETWVLGGDDGPLSICPQLNKVRDHQTWSTWIWRKNQGKLIYYLVISW